MATAAHTHVPAPRTVVPPGDRRRRLLPVAAGVAVTLLLVGCTGSASTSSTAASGGSVAKPAARAAGPAPAAAAAVGVPAGTTAGSAKSSAVGKVASPDVVGSARSRILTASVSLEVADVAGAAAAAARAATAAGGFVGTEQLDAAGITSSGGGKGRPTATSTLRVPPARLDAVLATLTRLGKVTAQQRSDTDVTGQVADLDARLVTQRASLVRLRGLFAGARDLSQITDLEQALTSRESDLESLTAQRKALAGQVDDATVTVTFTAPAPPVVVKASTPLGFGRGLAGGWAALVGTARVAAATLGALVPFLPVLAVVALLAVWRRRVSRRPRDGADRTPPPAGPPAATAG